MSATIATLPRTGGNGAALVVVVADLVMGLLAKNAKAAPKAKAVPVKKAEPSIKQVSAWQLYRLNAGCDSVNPKALAALQNEITV